MAWVVEVVDPDGNILTELQNATAVVFTMRLNRVNRASFVVDVHDPAATSDILHVGRNEIKIREGQTYFFGGVITNTYGTFNERGAQISVTASSYEWFLTKRYFEIGDSSVDTGYSSSDIGAIISAVINETQAKTNGDFGLSQGTIQTSVNRTREDIKAFDELYYFITLFTEDKKSESVDFDISPDKAWNVYYPQKGFDRPNVQFDYPGNIQSFEYERDAMGMANKVIVKGDGTGDVITYREVENTTQQTIYHLLHETTTYSSTDDTSLDNHGNGILEQRRSPVVAIRNMIVPLNGDIRLGDFLLGDTVRVKIDLGQIVSIDASFRIEELTVSLDEETISLGVAYA